MVRRFKASAFPFAAAETVPATLDADDISAEAVTKIQDGLGTEEKQDEILDAIESIADTSGTGAYAIAITVQDSGGNPLQNATVRLRDGVTGQSFVATTGADGVANFALDAATYQVTVTKPLYQHTPEEHVITAAAETHELTITMETGATIPQPDTAGQATGWAYTYDETHALLPAAEVYCTLVREHEGEGEILDGGMRTEVADGDGLVLFERLRIGATYEFRYRSTKAKPRRIKIADDDVEAGFYKIENFYG
jgi:hypothetical protein